MIDVGYALWYEVAVTITDAVFPADTIAWNATSLQVHELAGSVTVTATRTGVALGPVSVPVQVQPDTALPGVNYGPASVGTLSWPAGDTSSRSITIPILHDGQATGDRDFSVDLGPASGGALTALSPSVRITILDDDAAAGGLIAFSPAAISASAAAGQAVVTLTRSGSATGAVAVDWATVFFASMPFSALAAARPGIDAVPALGTVNWANGDLSPKTIGITLLDSGQAGLGTAFLVRLTHPVGGAVLDTSAGTVDATVTITSPAAVPAGIISLPATAVTAVRSLPTASVLVQRTAGCTGAVSVDYLTSAGTALDGRDFLPAIGTLSWGDGDNVPKAISLTLVAVGSGTPVRSLSIGLSHATGGAVIATAWVEVDLIDPFAPVILTSSLQAGMVGVAYRQTLTATNRPATWTISSGSLPAGLTLDAQSGVISGTPTTALSSAFTVTAANAGGISAVVPLGITIVAAGSSPPNAASGDSAAGAPCGLGSGGMAGLMLLSLGFLAHRRRHPSA